MDPITQATKLNAPDDIDPANSRSKMRKVMEPKEFTFDNSFWSHNKDDPNYAHQEDVYDCLGQEFLDHNFDGYHTCIFAYGQTGSGKSYTMMGTEEKPGLIPRTCKDLFDRIEETEMETPNLSHQVRVSYFEVYNEHVRDLLVPRKEPPQYLKIRESPTEGPYVKDLTDASVRSYSEIQRYMRIGDGNRTVASTKMNDTSSRSHSVFTIMLKQSYTDMDTDETTSRTARIRLVDLAGSERAKATEATGTRLREGSNINKSLTTLGRVIAALADPKHSRAGTGKRSKDIVPYRDSILTWLLKDSLGGNSKTAMIACIAPADYDETLSTLRYADQAKRIRTRAMINEDYVSAAARDAKILEMAAQIRALEYELTLKEERRKVGLDNSTDQQVQERLEEYADQVGKLQALMEERREIADKKIKALETQNEALRLHLKLALETLKNPIPAVVPSRATTAMGQHDESENTKDMDHEDKENTGARGQEDEEEDYAGMDRIEKLQAQNAKTQEMQDHVQELLRDLKMFRRKVGDDKSRFIAPLGDGKNARNRWR
jgi:hypothetical protein